MRLRESDMASDVPILNMQWSPSSCEPTQSAGFLALAGPIPVLWTWLLQSSQEERTLGHACPAVL